MALQNKEYQKYFCLTENKLELKLKFSNTYIVLQVAQANEIY